jgi:hypothetical protein
MLCLLFSCSKNDLKTTPKTSGIIQTLQNTAIIDEPDKLTEISMEHLPNDMSVSEFTFKPLHADEKIMLEVKLNELKTENIFNIYSVQNDIMEYIFSFPGYFFVHTEGKIQYEYKKDGLSKNIVFTYSSKEDRSPVLCFVDGLNGTIKIKKIYLLPDIYIISDDCGFVCVDETLGVPQIAIYNFSSMEVVKRVIYEPYRGKGMSPVNMTYNDNAFTVTLGADTDDFTIIEIPIDDTDDYRVVDSYSWEEEHN